jgi:4-nitrophenyl phosphatase
MSLIPISIKSLVLDMDGVLWTGDQPIGDLPKLFARLSQRGLKVCLATNNSSRTPKEYLDRLRSFGVGDLEDWQIVTSAHALTDEIGKRFPSKGAVYVIGETGLHQSLLDAGFTVIEAGHFNHTQEIQAVAVGFDHYISFAKLSQATLLIRRGVPFYATNPDRTFPTPEGLIPGVGAYLALLTTASEVEPIVVGKPAPFMFDLACRRLGTSPAETLVVGDRRETDIAGGQAAGCPVALLLSGVSNRSMADAWKPAPDVIAPDLTTLIG